MYPSTFSCWNYFWIFFVFCGFYSRKHDCKFSLIMHICCQIWLQYCNSNLHASSNKLIFSLGINGQRPKSNNRLSSIILSSTIFFFCKRISGDIYLLEPSINDELRKTHVFAIADVNQTYSLCYAVKSFSRHVPLFLLNKYTKWCSWTMVACTTF